MRVDETSDQWWKNAVVYCVDVETFLDTDGDGIGDLRGVTQQLDYLAGLGVPRLWPMPLYPSPRQDDADDIAVYYAAAPRLRPLRDLLDLGRAAAARPPR